MRRVLRKIATGQTNNNELGDISTLADETVVPNLIEQVKQMRQVAKK